MAWRSCVYCSPCTPPLQVRSYWVRFALVSYIFHSSKFILVNDLYGIPVHKLLCTPYLTEYKFKLILIHTCTYIICVGKWIDFII